MIGDIPQDLVVADRSGAEITIEKDDAAHELPRETSKRINGLPHFHWILTIRIAPRDILSPRALEDEGLDDC